MKYAFFLFLLLIANGGRLMSQTLIPFKFTAEDENRLIKENDTVRYYIATDDTVNVVALNEDALYYKLVNRKDKKKVVAEGGLVAEGDGFLQHGRWVQYHSNGKVSITGSYLKGKPAGLWEEYYQDGHIRLSYNYAIITDKDGTNTCISGSYQEFYNNGQLKVSGFYAADRNRAKDTLTVEDPVTGTKVSKTIARSVYTIRRAGYWDSYSENGELDKREEF
jgi:hypothetical protein